MYITINMCTRGVVRRKWEINMIIVLIVYKFTHGMESLYGVSIEMERKQL